MARRKNSEAPEPAGAVAADDTRGTYKALGNVKHNGTLHRKGAKLLLTAAEVKPLLKHKAVEAVK